MKRRKFLNHTALGAATTAALVGCSGSSNTQTASTTDLPTLRWKMATSWPQSLDTIFGGAETVCQRVSDMTGGRFTIKPFAAGEIVPGTQVLDAVQAGTVECGHTASYYYIGKNPALAFATSIPFGLNAQQQNAWLYHGGGLEAIQKIYSDFGIINFPAGNTGAQMGGWFKREIKSLADLQGLKMRIPGLGGKVMDSLGVNVQVLPGNEIFLALDRGAIDAAEWVGPYDDQKLGLNKAANFYYYPGWWEPG
ncbi:MAG: ABC transporter substrate-binding protein, partial [Symploca sp. SIO2D2]|nr:ABC transporter substrate-binding protein [Symploca sp. SIO2D2]